MHIINPPSVNKITFTMIGGEGTRLLARNNATQITRPQRPNAPNMASITLFSTKLLSPPSCEQAKNADSLRREFAPISFRLGKEIALLDPSIRRLLLVPCGTEGATGANRQSRRQVQRISAALRQDRHRHRAAGWS